MCRMISDPLTPTATKIRDVRKCLLSFGMSMNVMTVFFRNLSENAMHAQVPAYIPDFW